MWDVEYTDAFGAWFDALDVEDQDRVVAAVEVLAELGPGLGRPYADRVSASRFHHMKELRPRGGHLRVLFAFDPRRVGVLLVGGDKTDRWADFYIEVIAEADRLYADHLQRLRERQP